MISKQTLVLGDLVNL